ncbi:MAG TPA: phosphoribosylamine--glycine ligase [Chitinophagaceae bacterium]|nr:phosphoribosylamine--glycine ligase [Chitinophagaceae bacterium]
MTILLLGSGGREHALAWKAAQSKTAPRIFIAPGNAGTQHVGTNLPIAVTDFEGIKKACIDHKIDLLVVGPEEPLVKGLVDFLKSEESLQHLLIIGPSRNAAQLEGSKAFAKAFMQRHAIPTAAYKEFTAETFDDGIAYLQAHALPIVLKADGLAAGKGVIICQNHIEAISEFELMIQRSKFGEAGKRVVVEEFLNGIEVSVFVVTDGTSYVLLPEAKDYKRIGVGDTGPNTGGMGAISPVPFADAAFMEKVRTRIIEPTINGLQQEAFDYKGFVFIGVIKIADEPFVIEYNCRMGDPETEAVLPRIKTDLVELFVATANGTLAGLKLELDNRHACTIVAASGGYPGDYKTGVPITGLKNNSDENVLLFQAGTKEQEGRIVTAGGRVLCVTALSDNLDSALYAAQEAMEAIEFEGKYFRSDIGYEFVKDQY